jgi:hypothetical protein
LKVGDSDDATSHFDEAFSMQTSQVARDQFAHGSDAGGEFFVVFRETAIVRGGFPELYANPEIDSIAFYNPDLATYLERDVRALANVGGLRDVERFLRACALRFANLFNKSDLARDVSIAPSTANQRLSRVEASVQVVLLEPWFSNRTEPSRSSRGQSFVFQTLGCFARC